MNCFYILLGIQLVQAVTRLNRAPEFQDENCLECEFCCVRNECKSYEECRERQITLSVRYTVFLALVICLATALGIQVKNEGRGVNMKD